MVSVNLGSGINYGETNEKQREEIEDDIVDKLTHYADFMRDANSIKTSANFHLDARKMNNDYKVEIQWKSGIQAGLRGSLSASTNWQLT